MRKNMRIVLCCILAAAFSAAVVWKLWASGAFIFHRSAQVYSNSVIWNGNTYTPISGEYTEGRTIAKAKDGDWVINAVKQDPTHAFIVARSFLDNYLFVADSYTVPTTGKLTTVCWNGTYIADPLFLEAVAQIEAAKTTSFTYQTDGIVQLTENQQMRQLYVAYENCPVATNYKGYMGKVDGQWVITTYISEDAHGDNGAPKPYSVCCYQILSQYWDILSRYFS